MTGTEPQAADKRVAAEAAAEEVEEGMLVGLGTGSTAAFVIEAICRRVEQGLRIRAVVTSDASERLARARRIPLLDMGDVAALDLCIDGVDEIDPQLRAIKGAGGAMLREKVVAAAATRMIAIADASKAVGVLCHKFPVPIELLALARESVAAHVRALGGEPVVRRRPSGDLALTDQGNPILDCRFSAIPDPARLAAALSALPGALGHGLFVTEVDRLILGRDGAAQGFDRGNPPHSTHPWPASGVNGH